MQEKQTKCVPHSFSMKRGTRSVAQLLLAIVLLSTMVTLLSACGGNPQVQKQADQNRADLERTLQYARSIGVPNTRLTTVLQQEQAIQTTNAPLALFNDGVVTQYYDNVSTRYKQLNVQTQGIIQVSTEQLGQQAQDDLQSLQRTLAAKRNSGLPLTTITKLYNQNLTLLQRSRYPKDFTAISTRAKNALTTLNMMPDALDRLQTLKELITVMREDKQNVVTLQAQYDSNKNAVAQVTTPQDIQRLNKTVDAQNQQAMSKFKQAIPLLAQTKVDQLDSNVQQLKKDGIKADDYQKRLDADRTQMQSVKTIQQYQAFSKQVDIDLKVMQKDLLKGQATTLITQFHKDVNTWGNANQYKDKYNGQSYPLDGAYMTKGIGEDLDQELAAATTVADYQQTVTDTQNAIFHFQMMQADAVDTTPYTQVHATDQKLIERYKLQSSKVIVISFIDEALRVYNNGKLVRAFLITAGRPELPPVPGLWAPLWRLTNTTFKSPYPPGSPYWYADTPINYAIMYRTGGYFIHDSYWRNDYGPGTQFYHIDSSGNASANYGTHGCVNMPTALAAWLYNYTDYNTQIIMY